MNSGTKEIAPLVEVLLRLAFCQHIVAPDVDAGIEQLATRAGVKATGDVWRAAISDALAAGYIHDPVRLPAGALQCHWHLEVTPAGVEVVRR